MLEAHFVNIRNQILRYLQEAKKEVIIVMAWFTSDELFQSIISCCTRGVSVKLILLDDVINWQPYAPDFNKLITAGGFIQIADRCHGFLHHKFCVIDNQIVITGSYNWTYYAETRNLENVVISNDEKLIHQYLEEYFRLQEITSRVNECKRLAWSDIDMEYDVNFAELNYEIESISKARSLPKHEVLQTQVKVEVIEKEVIVYSNANIGILVFDSNTQQDSLHPLIQKGLKLPCGPIEKTFYSPIEKRNGLCLKLYTEECKDNSHLLLNKPLSVIVGDSKEEDLTIEITASLETNGYLRIISRCVETGRSIDAYCINPNLVCNE